MISEGNSEMWEEIISKKKNHKYVFGPKSKWMNELVNKQNIA